MSDSAGSGERTEKATPRRMKENREKGRLAHSKDLLGWIGMAAAVATLPAVIGGATSSLQGLFAHVPDAIRDPDAAVAPEALGEGLQSIVPALTPMLVAVVVATIVGAGVQGGIHFKKLSVNADNLKLGQGLKRVFGFQAMWEGVKALLKTAVVGGVLYFAIQGLIPLLLGSGTMAISAVVGIGQGAVATLLQYAVGAGVALAVVDLFVVMRRNRKHTMMTRKEVIDESKSTEGDPHVKAHRRSLQLAASRNRMMSAIARADVVIVNPTHIAIALQYEPGKGAPKVVAIGSGNIALKIREKADAAGVPTVQDIPLARALHKACDLGDEIPAEFFTSVAKVLAFVMALRRRGAALGTHRLPAAA